MNVLVTGSAGFIGQNLIVHLKERADTEVLSFTRENSVDELTHDLQSTDFVFHLAGVNRPDNDDEFVKNNTEFTRSLCQIVKSLNRPVPIVFASSTQAEGESPYGVSKRAAEEILMDLQAETGSAVHIFRLPNVFGKWCKPHYNSVVATFCHNALNGLEHHIEDPLTTVDLVYIDDVVRVFLDVLEAPFSTTTPTEVGPVHRCNLRDLALQIDKFKTTEASLITEPVGKGLIRALHATYLSYKSPGECVQNIEVHADRRGQFAEILKTPAHGQFSYFTAGPGVSRGGHYHHTKSEKFLVVKGRAIFGFRHIITKETLELEVSSDRPALVESIPGWAHSVTNVGDDEMIALLWSNEIFDHNNPDTFACQV